jgi:hypothetical protein
VALDLIPEAAERAGKRAERIEQAKRIFAMAGTLWDE